MISGCRVQPLGNICTTISHRSAGPVSSTSRHQQHVWSRRLPRRQLAMRRASVRAEKTKHAASVKDKPAAISVPGRQSQRASSEPLGPRALARKLGGAGAAADLRDHVRWCALGLIDPARISQGDVSLSGTEMPWDVAARRPGRGERPWSRGTCAREASGREPFGAALVQEACIFSWDEVQMASQKCAIYNTIMR